MDRWEIICTILTEDPIRPDKRERPWTDRLNVLDGILWILHIGAQWVDLPECYGNNKTVHRRFQYWREQGLFEDLLVKFAESLRDRSQFDVEECFNDGTFV
ncbi:MAG: transposase [Verrucomicrobiales bacterium]